MRKGVIFYILFIALNNGFSDNLSSYRLSLVGEIPVGEKEGQLGWAPELSEGGGVTGARVIGIDQNSDLYIPDPINQRISVYDKNIKYLRTIIEAGKKKCHFARYLGIDEVGNMYCLISNSGFRKISKQGKLLYHIDRKQLSRQFMSQRNFFLMNDEVFYYTDDDAIGYITNEGKLEDADSGYIRLNAISMSRNNESGSSINPSIRSVFFSKKHILIGNEYYNSDFTQNEIFYKKSNQTDGATESGNIEVALDEYKDWHLIGYDKQHNGYWHSWQIKAINNIRKEILVIVSTTGEILDAFYFGEVLDYKYKYDVYPTSGAAIGMSPDGDLYFLKSPEETVPTSGGNVRISDVKSSYKIYKLPRGNY